MISDFYDFIFDFSMQGEELGYIIIHVYITETPLGEGGGLWVSLIGLIFGLNIQFPINFNCKINNFHTQSPRISDLNISFSIHIPLMFAISGLKIGQK